MQTLAHREDLSRWVKIALIVILIPLATASLIRGMQKANRTLCDFEQFWVSSVLVRQGMNPYRVFAENQDLLLEEYAFPYDPDWVCASTLPERPNYNLPLLTLAITPLSWMDFYTGRSVWFGLQVLMAIALPLVMLRLNWRKPGGVWPVVAVLLLMTWAPLRTTFAHGQMALLTSLAVMLAIVLARDDQPLWAGLLLALAVSKYTLTGALLLFFLVYRYYRVLGVALLAQIVGALVLALLVGETPLQLVGSYATLLTSVIGQSYEVISLDGWFNIFGLGATASALLSFGIGAAAVLALVVPKYVREALGTANELPPAVKRFKANLLVVIMTLVGILFVYHRIYDLPIVFVYVTFLMGIPLPGTLRSPAGRLYAALAGAGLLLTGVMMIPPSAPTLFVEPPTSYVVAGIPMTLSLVLALGASILALHRLDGLASLLERGPVPAAAGQAVRPPVAAEVDAEPSV